MKKIISGLILALAGVLICSTLAVAETEVYQTTPITLQASKCLPHNLIQGTNYRISEEVQNDGAINTYLLNTNDGFIYIESNAELLVRINELNALPKMKELSRQEVFKDSLVTGVKAPFKLVGELVTSPIESTENIAEGTGSFFSNVGRSIYSSDPYQANIFKVALGYDSTKRAYAFEFGINPYTKYEPVEGRLNEISRAAVAGGIVPRASMAAIGGPVATTLRVSSTVHSMKRLVRDTPPGDLLKINEKKLLAMGVEPKLIKAFFNNTNYDPETRTILVGELETMKDVPGRNFFIAAATLATEETGALLYRVTAQMMADYHSKIKPAIHIGTIGRRPFMKNSDDIIILPLPLDYIFWTKTIAEKVAFINHSLARIKDVKGKEMLVLGKVEPVAATRITGFGWKIFQGINPLAK